MSKVLVISIDTIPIGDYLAAGTGIRSWEIAKGLREYGHDVTIAVPKKYQAFDTDVHSGVKIKSWDYDDIISMCDDVDAVFIPQGEAFFSNFFAEHIRDDLCVVVDSYDPNLIEALNLYSPDENGIKEFSYYLMGIIPVLKRGDFFVCATNRQRYYYLGVLNVLGRINPLTYNEKLIDIVPFGVPNEDPVYEDKKNVMRGSLVDNDDLVVLWFGGIYPWFDAITLIKAIDIAVKKNPKIKLVIMGAVHPRGHAPPDNYVKTLELSKQLGLYNNSVFFTEWRPYEERIYWYREADVGVCTYPIHLETELSNRTRIVDMLWGGLPIITTEGDELSGLIKEYKCGETVKPHNPEKLADVLIDILTNDNKRNTMEENTKRLVDERFRWEKVIKPLAEYLDRPAISKDRGDKFASETLLHDVDTIKGHKVEALKDNIKELAQQKNDAQLLLHQKEQYINELTNTIREKNDELQCIQQTIAWKIIMKYNHLIDHLLPDSTRRR